MLGYDSPQELVDSITNIAQQIYVDSGVAASTAQLMDKQGVVQKHGAGCTQDAASMVLCKLRAILQDGVLVRYEG